jgi:PAS domain S-box-containing protein
MIEKIDFEIIANSAYDWEYIISEDGKILYTSSSCQRITGYLPEEFYCNPELIFQIVSPEDKNKFHKEIILERGEQFSSEIEFRIIKKDGSTCWIGHTYRSIFRNEKEFLGFRISNRDISEYILTKQILRESDERYKNLFEGNKDALVIYQTNHDDSMGKIKQVNKAACKMLGYSKIELFDLSINDLVVNADDPEMLPRLGKLEADDEVTYETFLNHRSGKIIAAEVLVYRCLMGGIPHFVNIIRDVTERKLAENKLIQSEEKYKTLFNSMAVGVFYQSRLGYLIDANDAALKIFGLTREEFLGRTSYNKEWKVIDEEGKIIENNNHPSMLALRTGEQILDRIVGVFNPKRDDFAWVVVNAIPQFIHGGDVPYQVFVTLHDITERKRTEIALQKSEEMYRLLTERSNELICVHDLDGTYTYVSPSVEKLLGYKPEELLGTNPYELFHPDDRKRIQQKSHNPSLNGKDNLTIEFRIRKKDGKYIWFETLTDAVKDASGQIIALQTSSKNIVDRKKNEEEQKATIELLRIISTSSSKHLMLEGVITFLKKWLNCDAVGIRLKEGEDYPYYETSGFAEKFVKAEKYLCGYDSKGEIARDDYGRPILECMCGNILCGRFDSSKPFFTKHGSFCSNGTTELLANTTESDRLAHTRNRCNGAGYESVGLFPLCFGGSTFGLLQVNHKQKGLFTPSLISLLERLGDNLAIALSNHFANESLIKSEEKFHLLFENSLDGIFYTEPGGEIFSANNAACKMLGMTEEMIHKASIDGIIDSADSRLLTALNEREENGFFSGELTFVRGNGKKFPVELTSTIFKDKDGNDRSNIIFRDITERKHAEEKILSYSETLNNIFENTPYIMLLVDEDGSVLDINHAGEEFAHNDKINLLGHLGGEVFQCLNSFSQPGCGKNRECSTCPIRSRVKHTFETKEPINNAEGRMTFRINDELITLDLLISTTLIKQEDKDAVLISIIDLTERKKAEAALRDSEAKYRSIFETAAEGILIGDSEENIISVNQQMEKMLGYSDGELLGKNYRDLIPDKELEDHFEKKSSRKSLLGDVYERRLIKKDGATICCLVSASPVFDKAGNYSGAFGMFTDITERKNLEETTLLQRDFNYSLVSSRSLQDATQNIFHYTKKIPGIDCGGLYSFDDKGELISIDSFGLSESFQKYIEVHLPDSVEIQMAKSGNTLFLDYSELKMNGPAIILSEGIKCIMSIPLKKDGEVFALFNLASKTLEDFTYYQKGIAESVALQVANYLKRILAEQDLKRSEEKYRKFFEADLAGDYKSSIDGKLLDCNQSFLRILEFESKEHALNTNMEAVYPKNVIRTDLYGRLKKTGSLELMETELVTMKGKQIFVLESMIADYNSEGGFSGATGFMIDLTQMKIADKAIKESEKRYRQLFFHMQNGLAYHEIILDENGKPADYRFLDVNPQYESLTGLKKENIIGKTVSDVLPGIEKHWIEVFGSVALTQRSASFESLSKEIGKYFKIHAFSPERLKFAVLVEDVTERKKAEDEIREKEVQYHNLADAGIALIWSAGLDKQYNYFNEPWLKFTGRKLKQEIGNGWTKGIHPDDFDYCLNTYATSFNRREAFKMEYRLLNANGDYRWILDMGSPNYNGQGEFIGYIGHCFDITDRINAERELELYRSNLENIVKLRTCELDEANMRLQEEIRKEKEYEMMLQQSLSKEKDLNELKTRFISTASHEFRTPLTSIALSAGLIQRYSKKWTADKFNEHVERIQSSIKYLTKLLDDVLTISRTESGKIAYEPSTIELKKFCEELLTEIGSYITDKHNLMFNYGLQKKYFMLDEKLLKFMLSNLLSNAFKYSPLGGKVFFTVSSSKSNLIFVISDEGFGIPEVDKNLIYEPFHRSKNSIDIQGTGLGLSIVKRAVDLHGGEIWCNSEINKGTTFTIKIPRVAVEKKAGKSKTNNK